MTSDQTTLAILFACILGLLAWGRFRHDLIAALGLVAAVILGLVPSEQAFTGFSNEAVIVVALALVISRALENAGVLSPISRLIASGNHSLGMQIAITSGIGALLSTVMNNVAALALLMPLDIDASRRAKRAPGISLMALSFTTILGGKITLIGTPTNIIASATREKILGAPYVVFDFAPVGSVVAIAGILFIAVIGWRLIPKRGDELRRIAEADRFHAELKVPEGSSMIGKVGYDVAESAENGNVSFIGVRRADRPYYRRARAMQIAEGDHLIVEGSTECIGAFIKETNLIQDPPPDATAKDNPMPSPADENAPGPREIFEGIVRAGSPLDGASARSADLRSRFGLRLLGIARRGRVSVRGQGVADRPIRAGDTVLMTGDAAGQPAILNYLGLIPTNRVNVVPFHPMWAVIVAVLFAGAIVLAGTGVVSFPVALTIAVAGFAALGIVPAREFYTQIEWPIVVMLACLIPIGAALERVGATQQIGDAILYLTPGASPVFALVALMVVTLILSGILNNVATIVIFAPVAIAIAQHLHVNPDTFLMGASIAAACGFITPIAHKNNLLVMGPGGFGFGDFWQLGVPLSLVVLAVSVPMLLVVWPL